MRYLLALCVLLSPAVYAGQAVVTWTNPTAYTDNTVLVSIDITQTRVEYGSCSGGAFGTKTGEVTAPGSVTTVTILNLAASTYCFRAYTTAKGVESAASAVASKIVPQAAPNPPVLTTISTTAYRINIGTNAITLAKIGTVPLKLACDAKQSVNGYNVVPREKVKWSSSAHPAVVVARCG